jgi:hypothetical protein
LALFRQFDATDPVGALRSARPPMRVGVLIGFVSPRRIFRSFRPQ